MNKAARRRNAAARCAAISWRRSISGSLASKGRGRWCLRPPWERSPISRFPPLFFWPAFAVALTGLIWSLDSARLAPRPMRAAFWRVFAFGFAYYLVGMHWIAAAFLVDPDALPDLHLDAADRAAGGARVDPGGFVNVAFRFWCAGPARLILFSVAFMFAEWLRGSLFGIGGLPWNLPGMMWAPGGAVSQSASIWGIYGLSALTVIALASPATLADARARGTTGSRAAPIIVAAIVFGAIWGWGARRLGADAGGAATGRWCGWSKSAFRRARSTSPALTPDACSASANSPGPTAPDTPAIVIWPEGALPCLPVRIARGARHRRRHDRRPATDHRYSRAARMPGTDEEKALQLPRRAQRRQRHARRAGALRQAHAGAVRRVHAVRQMCFRRIGLKTLQKLAPGGFDAGPRPAPVRVLGVPPFRSADLLRGDLPGPFAQRRATGRAGWSTSRTTPGSAISPARTSTQPQARYRSIEEGLPMARVAAGGLTGMIDAYGRWTARGKPRRCRDLRSGSGRLALQHRRCANSAGGRADALQPVARWNVLVDLARTQPWVVSPAAALSVLVPQLLGAIAPVVRGIGSWTTSVPATSTACVSRQRSRTQQGSEADAGRDLAERARRHLSAVPEIREWQKPDFGRTALRACSRAEDRHSVFLSLAVKGLPRGARTGRCRGGRDFRRRGPMMTSPSS